MSNNIINEFLLHILSDTNGALIRELKQRSDEFLKSREEVLLVKCDEVMGMAKSSKSDATGAISESTNWLIENKECLTYSEVKEWFELTFPDSMTNEGRLRRLKQLVRNKLKL